MSVNLVKKATFHIKKFTPLFKKWTGVSNIFRLVLTIIIISCLVGCTNPAKAVKRSLEYGAKGVACITIKVYSCGIMAMVDGYADGYIQEQKDKESRKNTKFVKKMADKKAEDIGVKMNDCILWIFNCD